MVLQNSPKWSDAGDSTPSMTFNSEPTDREIEDSSFGSTSLSEPPSDGGVTQRNDVDKQMLRRYPVGNRAAKAFRQEEFRTDAVCNFGRISQTEVSQTRTT